MQTRLGLGVVAVAVGLSIVLVGVIGGIGTVGGTEDSGPLADAGLDQTTTEGSTVYLDAGGSTAPDGRIAAYEWSIETPSGRTIEPDCATCVTTSFVANESGTYEVSVEVTDEEDRSDSDMLYVEVEPYDPPEVSVTGPSEVSAGQSPTYTVTATATEEPLSSLLWRQDGRYHADARFSNAWSVTEETTVTFTEPGVYEVNATVADELGYQASDGMTVRVTTSEPYLVVEITDMDSPVQAGESLTVTATVENVGDSVASQTVSLVREGSLVGNTDVSLASGTQQTLEFTWPTTDEDVGSHEFVAWTANDTDRRNGIVTSGIEGSNVGACGGLGLTECLFEIGELEAEILDMSGNLAELDLKLVVPEKLRDSLGLESLELDPAEHDIEFVTADGDALNVQDDGTVFLEGFSGEEGEVQMKMDTSTTTNTGGPIELGADPGDTLEDTVTTPRADTNFEDTVDNTDGVDRMPGSDGGTNWGGSPPDDPDDNLNTDGTNQGTQDPDNPGDSTESSNDESNTGSGSDYTPEYPDMGDIDDILDGGSGGSDVDVGGGGGLNGNPTYT